MFNRIIVEDVKFIIDNLKEKVNINNLNNTNILITGGTGLFGKYILNTLISLRKEFIFSIFILTRDKYIFLTNYPEYNLDFIHFIEGDIRTFKIDNINFDYIIHAATPASDKLERENPDEMYSIILEETKNIINITKNMNVRKLLFTSSGAVYGKQFSHIDSFTEEYEWEPVTYYGKVKKISEKLFLDSNINVNIARCFAFIGPYLNLDIHFAIGNFIRDVLNNQDIIIKGDGTPLRTYMYTADLVIWLFTMLLKGENKYIYNVGASKPISILELAKKVSKLVPCYNGDIKVLTKTDENVIINRYIPNNLRIKEELKVQENFTIEESINRTLLFHRTEQNRTEQNRTEQNRTEQNRTEQIISKIILIYILKNYNQYCIENIVLVFYNLNKSRL